MATDLGTRVKRARERRRWTQRQLAKAIGVNIKTVDNWENGRTSPRNSIGALEEVLGVDLSKEPEEPEIPPTIVASIERVYPGPENAEIREQLFALFRQAIADRAAGVPDTVPLEFPPGRRRRASG